MYAFPFQLKPFLAKAKVIDRSNLQEITFSGPTYQIKIHDPDTGEDLWTFMQLDSKNGLRDAFCSCQEEENSGCWHLAYAYLHLFGGSAHPLHERYAHSFWKALGEIWFCRYKNRPKGEQFLFKTLTEKGKEIENDFLLRKKIETEENSIKFSNLSEEELEKWQKGKPSEALAFELSLWSDFTKFLLLYNEDFQLKVSFDGTINKLPTNMLLSGKDFSLKTSLTKEDWIKLIPLLNQVDSLLQTHHRLIDLAESIEFDEKKEELLIFPKKSRKKSAANAIAIGEWDYIPNKGFYPKVSFLPEKISGTEIDTFFNEYEPEIGSVLKNSAWNPSATKLHHHLSFDKNWNLHIDPYLFKPNDLSQPYAYLWKDTAYIPQKGFFRIARGSSNTFPTMIREIDIPDFIREYAIWLNHKEGFRIHLGNLDTQILYNVDAKGQLTFERRISVDKQKIKEFGPWIYVKGEGFFNKIHSHIQLPVQFGFPIREDQVSSFIKQNQSELDLITGFFLDELPLQDVGLEISLEEKDRIHILPKYVLKPEYEKLPWRFFDDWIYVENMGFKEMLPQYKLPMEYADPIWIAPKNQREFFEKELPQLQTSVRSIDPRLVFPVSCSLVLEDIKEASYHSWLLKFAYRTEKGKVSVKDILKAFEQKKSYLFTDAGAFDLQDERFRWLKKLKPESQKENDFLQLATIDLIRLNAFEEVLAKGEVKAQLDEILDLKKVPPFNVSSLKSVLRPYQDKGARWLFSLYNYHLGGLLCDEMGLGKTHQAMALMAAVKKINPKAIFLIVCPTSVLYHWEDKLTEFFPNFAFKRFHGTFRSKNLKHVDALLTTYGILRSDLEWIKTLQFDGAIFDELQVAKNHKSKLYHALESVKADTKIGLTGTPIENRLRELKSLFDLVLPSYMPTESDYVRLIVKPIERAKNMWHKSLLQRLTHPFVLRRQKKDVLKDLPEKIEEIASCELLPSQDKLYRDILIMQRDILLQDLLDPSKPVPYLHIFSLLARLKQICDHPALYYKQFEDYKKFHSGKWDLFVELLAEARESQQKVVVYSHYLGMLDIIETYLKENEIGFASLRGSTRDRKEQIALFTSDPRCEVFVASLKAAGLGIDLTAASIVIHYDRWWNAAREDQATDRVHRFGQNRGVQVFKLVTKNTFEERIHEIIERKKELMNQTIEIDDHEVLKTFTRDELYQLLQIQNASSSVDSSDSLSAYSSDSEER